MRVDTTPQAVSPYPAKLHQAVISNYVMSALLPGNFATCNKFGPDPFSGNSYFVRETMHACCTCGMCT